MPPHVPNTDAHPTPASSHSYVTMGYRCSLVLYTISATMPLRIGIDLRYVYDHFPGIGRYSVNLIRAFATLSHPHRLVLLHNPHLPNTRYPLDGLWKSPRVDAVATSARPFSLAEQLQIPWLARRLRLDVLHSPYYIKPYTSLPCPSVVTIHDLIGLHFPHTLPLHGRYLFRLTMWLAVHTARHIITVSRSARDDIVAAYGIPESRIALIPEAADPRFCPQSSERIAEVRARYRLPPRYVLYLGANKPHKNLERLILAWEQLLQKGVSASRDGLPHLIIAGHYDPRYPQTQQLVAERDLAATVTFVRNVAEADLPALYSGAEVFVFPSYYEGFGLPPLEAMACGAPVVCARASSLPEVVGDAAVMFDPYNVMELSDALHRLLNQSDLRSQLGERSLQQAHTFSWERTARATLAVYEDASRSS